MRKNGGEMRCDERILNGQVLHSDGSSSELVRPDSLDSVSVVCAGRRSLGCLQGFIRLR